MDPLRHSVDSVSIRKNLQKPESHHRGVGFLQGPSKLRAMKQVSSCNGGALALEPESGSPLESDRGLCGVAASLPCPGAPQPKKKASPSSKGCCMLCGVLGYFVLMTCPLGPLVFSRHGSQHASTLPILLASIVIPRPWASIACIPCTRDTLLRQPLNSKPTPPAGDKKTPSRAHHQLHDDMPKLRFC